MLPVRAARTSPCQQSCSLSSALADLAVASGAALKVCALREPGSPMHGGGALRAVIVVRLNSSLLKKNSVAAELQLTVRTMRARRCAKRCSGPAQGTIRDFDTAIGHIDHGGHDAPGPDGRDRRQGRERARASWRLTCRGHRHVDVPSRKKSRFISFVSRQSSVGPFSGLRRASM